MTAAPELSGRSAVIAGFVSSAGWGDAASVPLAGDASARRYARLTRGEGGSAILMDAAPERGNDTAPFLAIARLLEDRGFAPPAILAADAEQGLILLEDLGDALLARVVADDPGRASELYELAVDALVALHGEEAPGDLLPYGHDEMARLAALAATWYLPGSGEAPDPAGAARLEAEMRAALSRLAPGHDVIVLRDYHAENLLWLPHRTGIKRLGLLDFQDARAGHRGYDLVSLLEDARRDVAPDLRESMMARYIGATGVADDAFRAACAALSAQRNLRILGVFARLSLHYGKPHYVDLIPRVWAYLAGDLRHPELSALRRAVHDLLPEPTPARLARMTETGGTWPMR